MPQDAAGVNAKIEVAMAEELTGNLPLSNDPTPGYADISKQMAMSRVVQTFFKYESWRQRNYDNKWRHLQELYNGVVPRRFWEGTTTERASLSVRLIHSQVQSVLPLLHQALFGSDIEWFKVAAIGETSTQEAAEVQARLLYLCEHPTDRFGNNVRNQVTLTLNDLLVKGIAILALQVDPLTLEPVANRISPLDFYVDPACGPDIEQAKSVIWRRTLTTDQVEALRGAEGFDIPDRMTLLTCAQSTPSAVADHSRQMEEASRGVAYSPISDGQGVFGAESNLEVLIYYTKTRVVWVLNREYVIYNGENPYGFYPFTAATCFFDPDRFYGNGYSDVLADLQKYMQSIRNARLDELSLALNPPRVTRASHDQRMTFSQRIWRPGAQLATENGKDDIAIQVPSNITQNSYQEESWMQQQAQEMTGVNSMVLQGMPMRGNASASATSVGAQREAPSLRLLMVVLSLENYLLTPMLYKMLKMHQIHNQGDLQLRGMSAEGQAPVANESLQREVKFMMLSATRMMSREKLLQVFPFLTQYLLNPELMGHLQRIGMAVDMAEWVRMLQDASGTKQVYQLVRPLNEQEQQALMQPTPEMMQDQQKTKASNEVRLAMADKKNQAEQMKVQGKLQEVDKKTEADMKKEMLMAVMQRVMGGGAAEGGESGS